MKKPLNQACVLKQLQWHSMDTHDRNHLMQQAIIETTENQGGIPFYHRKTLKQHWGCVNALALSPPPEIQSHQRWFLGSGGDDLRLIVWDATTHQPLGCFLGHQSNIFSCVFDSSCRNVYSAGNDGLMIKFDITRAFPLDPSVGYRSNATELFVDHDAGILKISLHPENDHVLLSASQDGTIKLWDDRQSGAVSTLIGTAAQNCVQFHPTSSHMFVTSDSQGGIRLFDMRTSFVSGDTTASYHKGMLQKYHTQLSMGRVTSNPVDIPSVTFNQDGTLLCAIFQRWFPTLYVLHEPDPVCLFRTGRTYLYDSPDANVSAYEEYLEGISPEHVGQPGYKSCVTIKTGSFTTLGTSSEYYFSGSEDFRYYGWKVPSIQELNQVVHDNKTRDGEPVTHDVLYHNDCQVVQVDKADVCVTGHRSIVNSVLCHPSAPMIWSAGVEKIIQVHSIFPFPQTQPNQDSPHNDAFIPRRPHPLTRQARVNLILTGHPWGMSDSEDERMQENPVGGNVVQTESVQAERDINRDTRPEMNQERNTLAASQIHQDTPSTDTVQHTTTTSQDDITPSSSINPSLSPVPNPNQIHDKTDESTRTLVLFDILIANEIQHPTQPLFKTTFKRKRRRTSQSESESASGIINESSSEESHSSASSD